MKTPGKQRVCALFGPQKRLDYGALFGAVSGSIFGSFWGADKTPRMADPEFHKISVSDKLIITILPAGPAADPKPYKISV